MAEWHKKYPLFLGIEAQQCGYLASDGSYLAHNVFVVPASNDVDPETMADNVLEYKNSFRLPHRSTMLFARKGCVFLDMYEPKGNDSALRNQLIRVQQLPDFGSEPSPTPPASLFGVKPIEVGSGSSKELVFDFNTPQKYMHDVERWYTMPEKYGRATVRYINGASLSLDQFSIEGWAPHMPRDWSTRAFQISLREENIMAA